MVMPVISAPLVEAIVLMGPPTPQPTSKPFMPLFSPRMPGSLASCAASDSDQLLPAECLSGNGWVRQISPSFTGQQMSCEETVNG